MARQNGSVIQSTRNGVAFTWVDANQADGMQFLDNGKTAVLIWNDGSDGDGVVDFVPTARVDGDLVPADRSVTVGQGLMKVWGPGNSSYQIASGDDRGKIQMDFSGAGVANLKVAFISV